jgi:hypothetical protein
MYWILLLDEYLQGKKNVTVSNALSPLDIDNLKVQEE